MTKRIVWLTLIVLAIGWIGGLVWSFALLSGHDTVLSMTAFSISAVTFFGTLIIDQPHQDSARFFSRGSLRAAIASSVVVTYLFMLCFSTFIRIPQAEGDVAKSYIDTFSNLVGITIAFYFGASAAVQIFGKANASGDEGNTKPE